MEPRSGLVLQDEELLGLLAMRFRGTRDEAERKAIAEEYARTVDRLIARGWEVSPAPEDELPDAWMPEAYFRHWSLPTHENPPHTG